LAGLAVRVSCIPPLEAMLESSVVSSNTPYRGTAMAACAGNESGSGEWCKPRR
jgi:hypothetical protein